MILRIVGDEGTTLASEQTGGIHSASEGGMAGTHSTVPTPQLLVGSSTGSQFNTARLGLIPIACWKLDDIRFVFDSSFVLPDCRDELQLLASLIQDHTKNSVKPPITVFGHADPTGTDDYNKNLSGRRAATIYGMLTRRTEIWEDLYSDGGQYSTPCLGDKWGTKSLQIILTELGFPATADGQMGAQTQSAVENFQSQNGLPASGDADAGTRKKLFQSYMDKICIDASGASYQIDKVAGFLGQNADSGGKADFQGCSEFNPVLIFSDAENTQFEQDQDKTARDATNQPNRRVVVLLFRPGSRVVTSKWPCPLAKSDSTGCRARFWSDGNDRRSRRLPDQDRNFGDSHDTFACRFYHRLLVHSPCERKVITFEIRLYTPSGLFIPLAPFNLTVGNSQPRTGQANDKGILVAKDVEVPNQCLIQWGYPPEDGKEPDLIFTLKMYLDADTQEKQAEVTQKLHNLGYPQDGDFTANVTAFQRDYGDLATPPLALNGQLDDNTLQLIRDVYRSSEDDLRNQKPQAESTS